MILFYIVIGTILVSLGIGLLIYKKIEKDPME